MQLVVTPIRWICVTMKLTACIEHITFYSLETNKLIPKGEHRKHVSKHAFDECHVNLMDRWSNKLGWD